jgi:hypothetical protein
MKSISYFVFLLLIVTSCLSESNPEPGIIVEPTQYTVIKKDSLTSGEFLGLKIGSSASDLYQQVQNNGASYLYITSNFVTDFESFKDRILLYNYLLFDEMKGTENGVQVTFENNKIKSIYLNSGEKLSKWPKNGNANIREGDAINAVYDKLMVIKKTRSSMFERTSLLSKDLKKGYDNDMSVSPQWYYAYQPEDNHLNQVSMHLKDGKLQYIIVNYMRGGH